ncbi:MAG TPA: carboxypeptidase-like regulatory domain-containing protein, partial [Puia sp.]|nr:carboxypeptidase-like regulatory domain-containing protein [Puia sp.]
MSFSRNLPTPVKGIMVVFFLLSGIGSANANKDRTEVFGEIFVTVRETSLRLAQLFELVQKQTPLVFVYDENEVNLSLNLKLLTGTQPLLGLLDNISRQTGIKFTLVKSTILVSNQSTALKNTQEVQKFLPVNGTVIDESGNPLPGATISVKGTKTSVQTDANGNFSINAPDNAILIVSYTGYKLQEIAVNGQSVLKVNMSKLTKGLDEVVVVGYQSQKRSTISGAVTTVNVEDVSKIP